MVALRSNLSTLSRARMTITERRDFIADELYRALVKYDRELRNARDLRIALGGRGPTIKRGTKRGALAIYLANVVVTALAEEGEGT